MNRIKTIWIFLLVLGVSGILNAQDEVYLLPDRTACVSGDTIWFNVLVDVKDNVPTKNVVHVQLDQLTGAHVSKVSVIINGITGEGYLVIPDSLSTGIYTLKAYSNIQKAAENSVVRQRLINVYNRFETAVENIGMPEFSAHNIDQLKGVKVITGSLSPVGSRQINFELEIPEEIQQDLEQLIVTARVADPASENFSKFWIDGEMTENTLATRSVREQNGILITGRISSKTTDNPAVGAIVLLGISDTIPYFDYCVADEHGLFYFYVRDAYGTGNLVLQEYTSKPDENKIELFENFVETGSFTTSDKILSVTEREFAGDLIKAAYFNRFFKGSSLLADDGFSLIKTFRYPFYGQPTKSFYPEEFIDLPDFQEISREILRGVQYRVRKDSISIRLLDVGREMNFNSEPFRLLDGIPVFNNNIFADMGTTDVKKVETVYYKRFYGDISFNGILAIYTHQPSLSWTEMTDGVDVFEYPCLQAKKNWNYVNEGSNTENSPDFNTVLYRAKWEDVPTQKTISFDTSDIKGDIVIEVIGIGKDKQFYQHREVFNKN